MPFVLTKLEGWLIGATIALLIVAAVVVEIVSLRHDLAVARAQTQVAKDTSVVVSGQAAAAQSAASIADAGTQRDALTITVHQDNAHAIAAAPGASARIDPALNAAGRGGLCRYAAYAGDPGCAGLLAGDPALVPPARQADTPAGR